MAATKTCHLPRRALLALGLGTATGLSRAAAAQDAWSRPALMLRRPEQAVVLAAALAGARIVAVGERGIVLLSDDSGRSWRQVSVPVSVTLTTVRFADAERGYAVGHAGTVLGTRDGGKSWQRLLDGTKLAALVLGEAKAGGDAAALADAQRLAAGLPDRPLLDLVLLGGNALMAVGAYGLALHSADGGVSWQSRGHRLPNPKAMHLYAVRSAGASTLVVAGEQGSLFRSDDAGESFQRLSLPYPGSFFALELPSEREIWVAGLRGNVWRSADAGASWVQQSVPMQANITASARLDDGALLWASQAGLVLTGRDGTLKPLPLPALPPLNGLLPLPGQALLALSIQGPIVLPAAPR